MATDGKAEGSHHMFLIVMHEVFGTKHTLFGGRAREGGLLDAVGIRSGVKNLARRGCAETGFSNTKAP